MKRTKITKHPIVNQINIHAEDRTIIIHIPLGHHVNDVRIEEEVTEKYQEFIRKKFVK